MNATGTITMTMREVDRLRTIQSVVDGMLMTWQTAEPAGSWRCTSRATESTFSYFEATRTYLELHGKPVAFYSDKASVFRSTQTATTGGKGVTHFGRAMFELNIDGFVRDSSQAKGRVERANLTLQDRLVKELRLRQIDTRGAANAYAPHFIADYNTRFGKVPRSAFHAHRPLRTDENLDTILTWREPRRVTRSLTLQYDRVIYLLDDTDANQPSASRCSMKRAGGFFGGVHLRSSASA